MGDTITDADYQPLPFEIVDCKPVIFDKASWHSDCGDYITSNDPALNWELAETIRSVLLWLPTWEGKDSSVAAKLRDATYNASLLQKIGALIVTNATTNGLSKNMIGDGK